MGSFSQITIAEINKIINSKKYVFNKIEFERGLGIIGDAFYITLNSSNSIMVIRSFVNTRVIKNGKIILRYHDLFLRPDWKPLTRKEYRKQNDIELSLLYSELNVFNTETINSVMRLLNIKKNGDLTVLLSRGIRIESINDLDLRKNKRKLFELVFLEGDIAEAFKIVETKEGINIFKVNISKVVMPKDNLGYRFLLKD